MRSSLKLLVPVSPINFFIIIEHSNTPYKFNVRKTGSASPDKECRYLGMPCLLPTSNTHLASMSTVQLHHLTAAWFKPMLKKTTITFTRLFTFTQVVRNLYSSSHRGLYSSLLGEKPPYKKQAHFIKKINFWPLFINNSVLAQRTKLNVYFSIFIQLSSINWYTWFRF